MNCWCDPGVRGGRPNRNGCYEEWGKGHPGSGIEANIVLSVGQRCQPTRLRRDQSKTRQDRARLHRSELTVRAAGRHGWRCGSLSVLGMAANKDEGDLERLRILVSDGKGHRLEEVTRTVTSLGHEVVGHSSLGEVAASTASIRPDAAIVIVGESSERALDLIGRIVTEAACPVIAILDVEDEAFIRDAAKRGIFAYITLGRDASALQSSLDVVLSRFAEYHGLEGAFVRRAITERAKGILMERHSVDDQRAFEMLRDEARRTNRKLIEVAEAVTLSVHLLPKSPGE